MKTHYSISIPKPCHENWEKMIAEEKGKFCQSCSKTVVDFSQMPEHTIEDYLASNNDKKICGRFKSTQLATIRIKIPQQIIEQQMPFHRLFLLALLITMGTSLLNCSDQNGNTKKIDVVEVVDTLKTKVISIPETTNPTVIIDTSVTKVIPKKRDPIKKIEPPVPHLMGDIVEVMGDIAVNPDEIEQIPEEELIFGFIVVDRVPEFKGTPKNLSNSEKKTFMAQKINEIVSENFNTDLGKELNLKGKQRILVQFTIERNGFINDITTRAAHPKLEEEAKRVIELLPQFTPGQQRGKDVGVSYSLPIVFIVED